jgi:hypothetical protein
MTKEFTHNDYYFEALVKYDEPSDQSIFRLYSTKSLNKLKLSDTSVNITHKMNKYKIISNALIPVSPYEVFDMNIYVTNNDEIENFSVNYRNYKPPPFAPGVQMGLLSGYTYEDISLILIRSDFGHRVENPHTNINYYKESKPKNIKINDRSIDYIPQALKFSKYHEGGLDQMINTVLFQAERINPQIGLRYWLLTNYFPIDENQITSLWKESHVNTPLCILSNNIRNIIFNEFAEGLSQMSNAQIRKILIAQLQYIKEHELIYQDTSPIISLSDNIDVKFPFPMIYFPEFKFNKEIL